MPPAAASVQLDIRKIRIAPSSLTFWWAYRVGAIGVWIKTADHVRGHSNSRCCSSSAPRASPTHFKVHAGLAKRLGTHRPQGKPYSRCRGRIQFSTACD